MNRFTADYSSSIGSSATDSPPALKGLLSSGPAISTTPLVPPPSTIFGSSQIGGSKVRKPLFQKVAAPAESNPTPLLQRPLQRAFNAPPSQPKSRPFHTSFQSSISSTYDHEPEGEYDEDDMEEEDEEDQFQGRVSQPSLIKFSTQSARQSIRGLLHQKTGPSASQLPRKGQPDVVPGYARELRARAKPAQLEEDDQLIVATEDLLQRLQAVSPTSDQDAGSDDVDALVEELRSVWRRHKSGNPFDFNSNEIGPSPSASPLDKATYISSLLFDLHHQPQSLHDDPVPRVKVLLDWLDANHVSYNQIYRQVASKTPNVTSHEYFWDALLSMTLRGKLQDVMRLLQEADFKYAATARDDGEDEQGYHGSQLQTIQGAVFRARQLVNGAPFLHGNWDIASDEWEIYRGHVATELEQLGTLSDRAGDDKDSEADNFGLRRNQTDLFAQSQKPRNLPFSIYQGIKLMYSILMGSAAEIMTQSQDWLEASIALTVWWDGSNDAGIANWSLSVSQANKQAGDIEIDPYLGRLRDSFLCVTDPEAKNSFQVNGLSPTEVALGCALQGNIDGTLAILQALSQCVASAVGEVSSAAGWMDGIASDSNLNATDLMVLSFGAPRSTITKDDILQSYATALFGRHQLRTADGQTVEGWELSLTVLRRLDEEDLIHDLVAELLSQLDVSDQSRAEKAINLCTDLGLIQEARSMSNQYGDYLVNNTAKYGVALLCYARSHQPHKIQQLTDLLISYCLVQSRAYPSEEDIDDGLRSLVETPKTAFGDVAEFDPDAAASLQFFMVGYACIRRFYNLRDEQISQQKRAPGPLARRRTAAKVLIAAINSAADSIYGGLYDATRQSAIQVDSLLTLLGEATALVSQDGKRSFTSEQMLALLAAIEDLETVSSRVYDAVEECLQASLRNYHGSLPPSPHAMLKKSMSSGTNSNFSFSMMGSEMLAKSAESMGGKSDGSAFLVAGPSKEAQRGWDWREKFKDQDVTGRAVLRYLREHIAKDLSMAELDGL